MNGETIIALAGAGAAVFGAILSVLLLAFRVGTLTGKVMGFMETSNADRQSLHAENANLDAKLDRHIDQHLGRAVR